MQSKKNLIKITNDGNTFYLDNSFCLQEEFIEDNFDRIEERRANLYNILVEWKRKALGFNMKLNHFVRFNFKENSSFENIQDYIVFSTKIANLGYSCIPSWDKEIEDITKYFLILSLCHINNCYNGLVDNIDFSTICSLASEAKEDLPMFLGLVLNNSKENCVYQYVDEILKYQDNYEIIYLEDYIETLFIFFLEQAIGLETLEKMTNCFCENAINLIKHETFLEKYQKKVQEIGLEKQENVVLDENVEFLDLDSNLCDILE